MIVLLSGTMTYEGWGDGFYSNSNKKLEATFEEFCKMSKEQLNKFLESS